eukprot:CAMPEP_0184210568 /NCGR_PEP_ID=MMETSP0976-20121227/12679_1 /TAXON_ID=483370 /ORGANISM="non described non described, Strain CCMP2097" /LENGTH=48 /DNA_ID= /DNA_START= /DNA_END= /DNA_ORIENTATION=
MACVLTVSPHFFNLASASLPSVARRSAVIACRISAVTFGASPATTDCL